MSSFLYFLAFITLYFQVFFLITFIQKKERKGEKFDRSFRGEGQRVKYIPTVSIIVPCFNEEKTVEKTIQSLLSLNYPKDKLKIIAVDDGSVDATWDVLHSFFSGHPQVVILQKENEGSKFAALNFALQYVDTDLVGVLDADSWVDKNALAHYISYFREDENIVAVIPSMLVVGKENFIQKAQQAEYEIGLFARKVFARLDAIHITPGPFSVFRSWIFEELGPYREAHHTEDAEIALRIRKAGYQIAYSDQSIVYTLGPATISALIKQRVRWTYGFIKNVFDYKELLFNPHYGELGILILPLSLFYIFIAVFLFPLLLWLFFTPLAHIVQKILVLRDIPTIRSFRLDSFYLFFDTPMILSIISLFLSCYILYLGRRLVRKNGIKGIKNFIYFLFMNTFIAPIWLTKSLINVLRSKQESWR